ncbi:MAG: hypothetical protein M1814_004445 [Vezdaea aestivalis]|nr:MAG: hypothetical protein M1814_004445 [Vezdaea aestivalis]
MTSRYPPYAGDSRYSASRDSSPPRNLQRRPSQVHDSDLARDFPARDPPRAPKALTDSRNPGAQTASSISAGPRARDRPRPDFRDLRDPPPSSWKDRRSPPPLPRPRSPRPRSPDIDRPRRNSRDGPLSAGSSSSDPSANALNAYNPRGGSSLGRGRGRGDFDRGRGRGSNLDDRGDRFRTRSRSRDRWDREREREMARQQDIRRTEREDREREAEKYKRERLAAQSDQRGSLTAPSTPRPQSIPSNPASNDSRSQYEALSARRASTVSTSSTGREIRSELLGRPDPSKDRYSSRAASPPQAPQVPAFGTYQPFRSPGLANAPPAPKAATSPQATQAALSQGSKVIPTGPRNQPPPPVPLRNQPPPPAPLRNQPPSAAPLGPKRDRGASVGKEMEQSSRPPMSIMASMNKPSQPPHPQPVDQSQSARPRPQTGPQIPTPRAGSFNAGQAYPRLEDRPLAAGRGALNQNPTFGPNIPTGPRAERASRARGVLRPRGISTFGPPRGNAALSMLRRESLNEDRPPMLAGRGGGRFSDGSSRFIGTADGYRTEVKKQSSPTQESTQRVNGESRDVEMTDVKMERQPTSNSLLSADTHGPAFDDADDDEEEDDITETIEILEENDDKYSRDIAVLRAKITADARAIEEQSEHIEFMKIVLNEHADELAPDDEMQIDQPTEAVAPFPPTAPFVNEETDILMHDVSQALQEIEPRRARTPPLDSLPFLIKGPQKPFSELDCLREIKAKHAKILPHLQDVVIKQRKFAAEQEEEIKEWYIPKYRVWRETCEELDKAIKDGQPEEAQVDHATDPPSPTLVTAPLEGRRGGKFASEFDLERILKESEQAAREAAAKAKEADEDKFDIDKEAEIPQMVSLIDRDAYIYQDFSNLVAPPSVVANFEFVAAFAPFSAEEQAIFTDAYMTDPKRFGRIATVLPNRTFQECIHHYYLTKGRERYKLKLGRFKGRNKGRGGKKGARSRVSNALIADLATNGETTTDGDGTILPVTDTGRPRRAAAPTFGEVPNESDSAITTTPIANRRGGNTKGESNSDAPPAEKSNKRAKTTATKEKGSKRGKNQQQLLAAAPTPSPLKQDKTREKTPVPEKRDTGDVPAVPDNYPSPFLPVTQAQNQPQAGTRVVQPALVGPTIIEEKPSQPRSRAQPDPSRSSRAPQGRDTASNSYWSVPESQDFPRLLAYYGTNWDEFAQQMTSKSATMIKNHYQRSISRDKRVYEKIANEANERRARKEDLGPPPAVSMVVRKRHDTPQPSSHRTLAPSVEPPDHNGTPSRTSTAKPSPPQHTSGGRFPNLSPRMRVATPERSSPQGGPELIQQQPPPLQQIIQQSNPPQASQVPITVTSIENRPGVANERSPLPARHKNEHRQQQHLAPAQSGQLSSRPQPLHQRSGSSGNVSSGPDSFKNAIAGPGYPVEATGTLLAPSRLDAMLVERQISQRESRYAEPALVHLRSKNEMQDTPRQSMPPQTHQPPSQTRFAPEAQAARMHNAPLPISQLPREEVRASAPPSTTALPPPRPAEVRKTSNIMSLLNPEPSTPKSVADRPIAVPTPPPQQQQQQAHPPPPFYPPQHDRHPQHEEQRFPPPPSRYPTQHEPPHPHQDYRYTQPAPHRGPDSSTSSPNTQNPYHDFQRPAYSHPPPDPTRSPAPPNLYHPPQQQQQHHYPYRQPNTSPAPSTSAFPPPPRRASQVQPPPQDRPRQPPPPQQMHDQRFMPVSQQHPGVQAPRQEHRYGPPPPQSQEQSYAVPPPPQAQQQQQQPPRPYTPGAQQGQGPPPQQGQQPQQQQGYEHSGYAMYRPYEPRDRR